MFTIIGEKDYKDSHYFTLQNENGQEPYITTDFIDITHCDSSQENITFIIKREMSQALYDEVLKLESCLVNTIKNIDNKYFVNFPFHCQQMLSQHSLNDDLLRPNYYSSGLMYLKGNFNNIKIMSGNEQIHKSKLGPGKYQFIIRANLAYIGPHKEPKQIANLQLRISEIHFTPKPALKKIKTKAPKNDIPAE